MVRPAKKSEEGGYALLFVLLLAALVAISLYRALPRVAFDTQRQKEQMLIERGEQYKRAIQIFVRANNNTRWPATLDELENFNGKHFLRHRYKDPMTGKDEWRLVHIAGGVLTDSVLNKPKQTTDQANATDQSQYLTQMASIGSQANQDNGQQNISAATRRRASEGGVELGPDGQPLPATGTLPGAPGGPSASGMPGGMPGIPGVPGIPGQSPSGQNPSATLPPTSSSSNGNSGSGFLSSLPSMGSSSSATGAGAPVNSQVGGVSPYSTAAGANGAAPGYGQAGMSINPQSQSAAAALIGGLLTQPRPGGLSGLSGQQGQIVGGGIAGVASKAKGESIMVYDDRTDYSEWEFNWDPTKAPPNPPNPNQGTVGTPMSQAASTGGAGSGFSVTPFSGSSSTPAASTGSAFGAAASNGTGAMGGFASNGTGAMGGFASNGTGAMGGFGNGGSLNSTTANGAAPNGATGQTSAGGGLAGGGALPNIRPGAP